MDFRSAIVTGDGMLPFFDWILATYDLASDLGLQTAVILSLFSDRKANADDVLPDNSGDRRGWWGDTPISADTTDTAQPDLIGSRLWLLARAKATIQTAAQAKLYCTEALAWLLADGVALNIQISTSWLSASSLSIVIIVSRLEQGGTLTDHKYDFVWTPTLAGTG